MKIYQHEINKGLDKLITANAKASVGCPTTTKKFTQSDTFYQDDEQRKYVQEYVPDGMTLINAILVSTNWNKNDDVFTNEDTWRARHTPYCTPANLNHQGREGTNNSIIGVVSSTMPVNDDYKWLDVPKENDLPESFHLLVGIYVWAAYFPSVMETLSSKIDKGEMFVSMEAFFDDFGYALRTTPYSKVVLLPRNDITSWLTSYLRVYGGNGRVTIDGVEYQIGRWLRDITFSGVGFVENPANPESIIFDDYIMAQKRENIKFEYMKEDLISRMVLPKEEKENKKFVESCVLINRAENSIPWLIS